MAWASQKISYMSWLEPKRRGAAVGVVVALLAGGNSVTLGGVLPNLTLSLWPRSNAELPQDPARPVALAEAADRRPSLAPRRRAGPDPLQAPDCAGYVLTIASEVTPSEQSLATLRSSHGRSYTASFGGYAGDHRIVYVGSDPRNGTPTAWLLKDRRLCRARMFAAAGAAATREAASEEPAAGAAAADPATSIELLGDGRYRVDRRLLLDLLSQPERLAAGVLAAPSQGGFALRKVAPSSLAARLGFRSGDRLVQVDGIPLSDMEGLMRAAARLSAAKSLRVQLSRAGRAVELEYRLE